MPLENSAFNQQLQKQRADEEIARSQRAYEISMRGFVRGATYGLAGGLAASLLAQRYSASYRALRLPVKAAGVSSTSIFGTSDLNNLTPFPWR